MNEIFLSYRRDDSSGHVDRLYSDLVGRYGDKAVFMDRTIEPGGDFPDAIREAVENATVALVVIGPRWLGITDGNGVRRLDDPKDWVAIEVASALGCVPNVVPVLLDEASLPQPTDLPELLSALPNRQKFDLGRPPRWEPDLRQLTQSIDRWLREARSRSRTVGGALVPAAVATLLMLVVWGTQLLSRAPLYPAAKDTIDRWVSHGVASPLGEGRVALIVDEAPPEEEELPLRRDRHAELIAKLRSVGASVIAFDYYFDQSTGVEDPSFAKLVSELGAPGSPVALGAQTSAQGGREGPRLEQLVVASSLAGVPGAHFGLVGLETEDNAAAATSRTYRAIEIARFAEGPSSSLLQSVTLRPSLPLLATMLSLGTGTQARYDEASRTIQLLAGDDLAVATQIPVRHVSRGQGEPAVLMFRLRLSSQELDYNSYGGASSALDAPDEAVDARYRGRVVLVGSADDEPQAHLLGLPGYQVNAQLLASLLAADFEKSSRALDAAGLVLCAALGVGWRLRRRRPDMISNAQSPYRHGLLAGVDLGVGVAVVGIPLLIVSLVAFRASRVQIPLLYWLLSFAATYALLTIFNRRRKA